MKIKSQLSILLKVGYTMMFLAILVLGASSSPMDVRLTPEATTPLNDHWMMNNKDVSLLLQLKSTPNEPVTITNTLPSSVTHNQYILFRASLQSYFVTIDGKEVIHYDPIENNITTISPSSIWLMAPLTCDMANKPISVTVQSQFRNFAGFYNEIHIGTKTALYAYIIKKNLFMLLTALFIFVLASFLLFSYFSSSKQNKDKSILYLACTNLAVCAWFIGESQSLQFITNNYFLGTRFAFVSLNIIPIFMVGYFHTAYEKHHKQFDGYFLGLFLIQAILLTTLHVLGWYDFFQSIYITNFFITLYSLYILISITIETFIYKNKKIHPSFYAAIIPLFGFLLDMYYLVTGKIINFGSGVHITFVIFMILLSIFAIIESQKIRKSSYDAITYERLAYTDLLTQAKNRTAYEKVIQHFDTLFDHENNVWLLLGDIDNLKQVNDTYGHLSGDEVIKNAYACLSTVIGPKHIVYRIGGDEFACLLTNKTEDEMIEIEKEIETLSKTFIGENNQPLKISIGYGKYEKNRWSTYQYFYHFIDEQMYANKRRRKEDKQV